MTRAALVAAYLGALLAVDTQVSLHEQFALGALTWLVLIAVARALPPERRAQVAIVVCAATVAEVTGSILWGVYTYRLHNLPLFVPPAHGLVFVAGLSLSQALRRHARTLVALAAAGATSWGVVGLTVLPRTDAAGALGVPLLLAFLWRSRARAAYAGVFLVVGALELYGTAIGTWRWAPALPGVGVPDGNPPSGVASGYVWFDVMALLLAPRLLAAVVLVRGRWAGEVKWSDEPPDWGRVNPAPPTIFHHVAHVLEAPTAAGAGPKNCGGAGHFEETEPMRRVPSLSVLQRRQGEQSRSGHVPPRLVPTKSA